MALEMALFVGGALAVRATKALIDFQGCWTGKPFETQQRGIKTRTESFDGSLTPSARNASPSVSMQITLAAN